MWAQCNTIYTDNNDINDFRYYTHFTDFFIDFSYEVLPRCLKLYFNYNLLEKNF